jgi:hypothetical protein
MVGQSSKLLLAEQRLADYQSGNGVSYEEALVRLDLTPDDIKKRQI